MSNLNTKILYLGLHNQLIKKFGNGNKITRKELFCKLGKHYMIPKKLRHLVMKEMEEMLLIETVDRDHVILLSCDIDIEKDTNKLYKLAGIF